MSHSAVGGYASERETSKASAKYRSLTFGNCYIVGVLGRTPHTAGTLLTRSE